MSPGGIDNATETTRKMQNTRK